MQLRQYILWALVPAMAVLLYHIIFRRGRKRPELAAKKPDSSTDRFLAGPRLGILPRSNNGWPRAACHASPTNRFPAGWNARWPNLPWPICKTLCRNCCACTIATVSTRAA